MSGHYFTQTTTYILIDCDTTIRHASLLAHLSEDHSMQTEHLQEIPHLRSTSLPRKATVQECSIPESSSIPSSIPFFHITSPHIKIQAWKTVSSLNLNSRSQTPKLTQLIRRSSSLVPEDSLGSSRPRLSKITDDPSKLSLPETSLSMVIDESISQEPLHLTQIEIEKPDLDKVPRDDTDRQKPFTDFLVIPTASAYHPPDTIGPDSMPITLPLHPQLSYPAYIPNRPAQYPWRTQAAPPRSVGWAIFRMQELQRVGGMMTMDARGRLVEMQDEEEGSEFQESSSPSNGSSSQ